MIRINDDITPDPEIEELSPNEKYQLIHTSWDDNNFPLKFNKELKYSDIKDSVFFTNTTTFLKILIEMENKPTATAKGNLNRKIVKIIFDKLILEEDYKKFTLKYNTVINETDVFPLNIIRVVCESAGLIFQTKNRFLFSEEFQQLLSEERAGELYHLLFISFFRNFNLGYLDRFIKCKKCSHGARLYHDPSGGCITSCKGAPAVPFTGSYNLSEPTNWVFAVCKRENCKDFNKLVFLSEKDFYELKPPLCHKCENKMKPERERQETGDYAYMCENDDCHVYFRFTELLPDWGE